MAGTSLYWLGSLQLTVANAYDVVNSAANDVIGLDVDSQDRVLLGTLAGDYYTLALHRFGAGTVDTSFGTNGLVSSRRSVGRPDSRSIQRCTVVFGTGDSPVNNNLHFNNLRLARFTPAGALDPGFGNGGARTDRPVRNFGPSSSRPARSGERRWEHRRDRQDSGDTLVFGRYNGSGVPDPALSADGFTFTINPTTSPTEPLEELLDLQMSPTGSTFATLAPASSSSVRAACGTAPSGMAAS